jgi:hypothetical protein
MLLTDNAPTAWYGARRARVVSGDTVAVIGAPRSQDVRQAVVAQRPGVTAHR